MGLKIGSYDVQAVYLGSTSVSALYLGAALAFAPAPVYSYDTSASLPNGVTVSRASSATYFDSSLTLQTAASNAARFGYDPQSGDALGLLVAPSGDQYNKNNAWAGAVAASDTATFNTAGNANSGTWGTVPSSWAFTFPATTSGSVSSWQIAAKGTYKGMSYIDLRLKYNNATGSQQLFRAFFQPTSTGIPAAINDTWTQSIYVGLVAGAMATGGNMRLTLRSLNGSTATQTFDTGQSDPTATPTLYSQTQTFTTGTVTGASSGISLAIPNGISLDITLRLMLPGLSKTATPVFASPVSTDNSVGTAPFASRAADTVTIAVPDGTYNVRWVSKWKNIDESGKIASGGAGLTLTCPAAAIAAGIFGFTGLIVTTGLLPFDTKLLAYSPPSLGSYVQRITVPAGATYLPTPTETSPKDGHTYGSSSYYESDVDVIVTIPPGGTSGNLRIVGGRTVRIIGGQIAPTSALANNYLLSFIGQSTAIFIEGVLIDGSNCPTQADAIDVNGQNNVAPGAPVYYPDVYLQNVRAVGVKGNFATTHGDIFQPQGPMGRLLVDKLTGASAYQGFFVPPQNAITSRSFSRANMKYQASGGTDDAVTYQFWLQDNVGQSPVPTTFSQVYAEPRAGQDFATQTVWPTTTDASPTLRAVQAADGSLSWPGLGFSGFIQQGPPSGGDFVPSGYCGSYYKSPGYKS